MGQSPGKPDLGAVFDQHVRHGIEDKDVEATMTTMIAEPYGGNVPTARGGIGGVRRCDAEEFVGKMLADTRVIPVSRTIGENQLRARGRPVSTTTYVEVPWAAPRSSPASRHPTTRSSPSSRAMGSGSTSPR